MRKLFVLAAAATFFVGVTALAQENSGQGDAKSPGASSPASDTSPTEAKTPNAHRHHMRHENSQAMRGKGSGTDWSADKLNACMPDATPTPAQESCLRQASQS